MTAAPKPTSKAPSKPTRRKPQVQGFLRLPVARVEQMKALAARLGLSLSDTIGHLLNEQIAAGNLEPIIPGVSIKRNGEAVVLGFGDHPPAQLTIDDAKSVAAEIRQRIAGSELRQNVYAFVDAQAPDFGLRSVRVQKKGTGVNLHINGEMKSFSLSLAKDLADLIEKTAA